MAPLHARGQPVIDRDFYLDRDPAAAHAAFDASRIDVTVRDGVGQVRVSPALFNTADEIARFLEVTKRLRSA